MASNQPRMSGISVVGYDVKPRTRELDRLSRAIDAARLKVAIEVTYPLALAARAHGGESHVLGKVVRHVRRYAPTVPPRRSAPPLTGAP